MYKHLLFIMMIATLLQRSHPVQMTTLKSIFEQGLRIQFLQKALDSEMGLQTAAYEGFTKMP